MKLFELKSAVEGGKLDARFADVYGGKAQAISQRGRYLALLDYFENSFPGNKEGLRLFSSPGRTEICGNHTDHNHGKVLAASIDLDSIAAVYEDGSNTICIYSMGNGKVSVDVTDLSVHEDEKGTSNALVRGICAAFADRGYKIGGFEAVVSSQVLMGSGLSSSASYEILIATILNCVFNNEKIDRMELAQMAQYAENEYFGKPCGLMDQMSCVMGGFVYMDFADPKNPWIEKIDFDYEAEDYVLCIVDTGGNHADLTNEYAAIKTEMCEVAKLLGGEYLRDVPFSKFITSLPYVREKAGDRALQRAMHFYLENDRVDKEVKALLKGDFESFKSIVQQSGDSSFKFNQNVFTSVNPRCQPVALALAISEYIIGGKGVCRVHGGGFAGTIQAFVPRSLLHKFTTDIKAVFGDKSCYILSIRTEGSAEV